ncbi:MAG: TadE family protein [Desulfobulbaceae bacterium]
MMPRRKIDSSGGPDRGISAILSSEAGQSMAEFLVILPVMLLLIFGAIQFALIFHAKITLNYAAFEGVRAGTLNNGRFDAVKEGFARGLAPLYSYFDPDDETDGAPLNQVAAFQAARDRIFREFDDPEHLVRIERLNPTEETFKVFAPDGTIPNDNLRFRSASSQNKAGVSIQGANLLHLRFTYCYPLYVPFVNRLIGAYGKRDPDPICSGKEPRIPLTAVAAMRMQSPPQRSDGYGMPGR